jgi:hypothetical protein
MIRIAVNQAAFDAALLTTLPIGSAGFSWTCYAR